MLGNLEHVIAAMGNAIGLPDLRLDEDGYCCLAMDEVQVHIESLGETQHVLMHTCLGAVPPQADAALYARLLHAKHFFAKTSGATIGTHPDSGSIDMALVLEAQHISAEGFLRALQSFVNAAEWWMRELSTGGASMARSNAQSDATHSLPSPAMADWLSQRV